jgi:predicted phage tail component-like protein
MEVNGLLISELPPITKPQMRVTAEEIDGRAGDIVTELGFSAYDKEISIGLHGDFDIDDVIDFFNQSGKITFSNEPDKFYNFAQYDAIDFEKLIRFKTAKVKFHVQPFKFGLNESEKTFVFSSSATSGELSIRNNGNYPSRPQITLTGSGTVNLSINGAQVMVIDMSENPVITLDATAMNAYAPDTSLMNRHVTGNYDNLVLKSGKNTISFSGTLTQIAVNKYSRWL